MKLINGCQLRKFPWLNTGRHWAGVCRILARYGYASNSDGTVSGAAGLWSADGNPDHWRNGGPWCKVPTEMCSARGGQVGFWQAQGQVEEPPGQSPLFIFGWSLTELYFLRADIDSKHWSWLYVTQYI